MVAAQRGMGWRVAAVVVVLAGATGCGPRAAVPVPTFPTAPPAPTTTAPAGPDVRLGLPDCEQLVGHDELPALLGLPVGSVTVRTVVGVPAPAVGRLQRTDCTYSVADPDAGPLGVVLRMTVGAFGDAAAARAQHDRNVADQQVGAAGSRQPSLGAAAGVLVDRAGESVLLTCYDTLTVDLDLPQRTAPLPPGDLLTDLARRVLARLTAPPPGSPGSV